MYFIDPTRYHPSDITTTSKFTSNVQQSNSSIGQTIQYFLCLYCWTTTELFASRYKSNFISRNSNKLISIQHKFPKLSILQKTLIVNSQNYENSWLAHDLITIIFHSNLTNSNQKPLCEKTPFISPLMYLWPKLS